MMTNFYFMVVFVSVLFLGSVVLYATIIRPERIAREAIERQRSQNIEGIVYALLRSHQGGLVRYERESVMVRTIVSSLLRAQPRLSASRPRFEDEDRRDFMEFAHLAAQVRRQQLDA